MKSEEEIPKNHTREPTKTKPNKYACKQNEKDKEGKVYIQAKCYMELVCYVLFTVRKENILQKLKCL